MTYIGKSGVEIGAWAAIGADSEINYLVLPGSDTIEFTIGGRHGLDLDMSEAGLRRCVAAFSEALDELNAVVTRDTDETSPAQSAVPTPSTTAPTGGRS